MVRTTDQIWATAYHEAGHVVVAYYFGKVVSERGVTIDCSGNGNAHVRRDPFFSINAYPEDLRDSVCRRVRAQCLEALAGIAAEDRITRKQIPNGGGGDWANALTLLNCVYGMSEDSASGEMRANLLPATRRLIRRDEIWKAIEALSNSLYSSRQLSMDEANDILVRSEIRPLPSSYWTGRRGEFKYYWMMRGPPPM